MFSKRFRWSLEANKLARLIEEKRRSGAQILDLTVSNPTRVAIDFPVAEILDGLTQAQSMRYEATPRGLPIARQAVADYYREHGFDVDPDRIHLTASTSEGYSYLFKLLVDHGQSVLVPQPSYPLFEFLAALEGVNLQSYELSYLHPAGWRLDFDSIKRAITTETRAIIIVNPNNPTGSFIKKTEIAELNEICSRHELALIIDEVFNDYPLTSACEHQSSFVNNDSVLTFVMSGLSKVMALPQMKLGWIVTNGPVLLRERAIERLDLIADTFLSVGTPVQHALPFWFKHRSRLQAEIINRASKNLDWLAHTVESSSCRLLKVEGGWSAILEIPRILPEEELILKLLRDDDVLIHPGYFFDFSREAFLVLSLLPPGEIFHEAVNRMISHGLV